MQEHAPETTDDPFARSRQLLESMIAELKSTETGRLTQTQIEDQISRRRLEPAGGAPQPRLRKLAAAESTRGSFADAADAVQRVTGAPIGKRQRHVASVASLTLDEAAELGPLLRWALAVAEQLASA
ncbi:MAG: hypothetical protein ACRDYA_21950 [Egibacteraceae bacterium]